MRFARFLLFTALSSAVACGGGSGAGDSGPSDDGSMTGDGSAPDTATGDGGGTVDAGDVPECRQAPLPLGTTLVPRCSFLTRDCVTMCNQLGTAGEVAACQDECVANDPWPSIDVEGIVTLDCADCMSAQYSACIFEACPDELGDFECCGEEMCGAGSSSSCARDRCSSELDAVVFCIPGRCNDYASDAFARCFTRNDDGPCDSNLDCSAEQACVASQCVDLCEPGSVCMLGPLCLDVEPGLSICPPSTQ